MFTILIAPCPAEEIVVEEYNPSISDSLLNDGFDEVLSYLLLNKGDFVFRNDYTAKDIYRLAIVDRLMKEPLRMASFSEDFASRMFRFWSNPDSSLIFLHSLIGETEGASDNIETLSQSQGDTLNRLPDGLLSFIESPISILADYQNRWQQNLGIDNDSELYRFIISNYRQLLLEDENFKEQSVEEMDSVKHIEQEYTRQFAELGKDIPDMIAYRLAEIVRSLDAVKIYLEENRSTGKTSNGVTNFQTEYGKIAIGSFGDDIYRGDYFIIIDPGGNDSYFLSSDIANLHSSLIADFSGDDIYIGETDFALASGAFGLSCLIDYAGNDIYRGRNFSVASGFFGCGILWDKNGNDSYFGDTFTQGAGTFGIGLLIDGEGSDTYTGNLFCQGFGYVRGIGGIIDDEGNDTYIVQPKYPEVFHPGSHFQSLSQGFALGARPDLSGGMGFICDRAGNDTYVSDFFSQGASYWWSLGLLYDRSGNDQYLSYQYSQGSGAHMTLGMLLDGGGDDVYRSHGVCQGCGHDYSCGWLLDRSGDDTYSAQGLAQGAGQANGFGIFTDLAGDDGYYTFLKTNTQGYGNPRRDYGSIGVFLDLDGDDRYGGNGSNDLFWQIPGKWGGGLDRSYPAVDSTVKR